MGYLVSPYPYPNGAGGPIPVSMVSRSPVIRSFWFYSRQIWHASRTCHRLVRYAVALFYSPRRRRDVRTARLLCGLRFIGLAPRLAAGSWSRYWFMASANWIHDLYLQLRSRVRALSLSCASRILRLNIAWALFSRYNSRRDDYCWLRKTYAASNFVTERCKTRNEKNHESNDSLIRITKITNLFRR